jgi:FixH
MSAPDARRQELDGEPWYRQFWPWFLIALPGSVVIASFVTLYIASSEPLDVDPTYGQRALEVTITAETDGSEPQDCAPVAADARDTVSEPDPDCRAAETPPQP